MDMQDERSHERGRSPGRWVFIGFALVAGYFLLTEHRAHLLGALPYLLFAACPLMHLFHHHGHGGHGHGHHGPANGDQAKTDSAPARPES